MIVVEVKFPILDTSYDFKLDEDTPVSLITDDMIAVISQKEHKKLKDSDFEFMLFNSSTQTVLTSGCSLYENGVKSGDSLILI
ncbi:MAG: hypothetical protein IIU14_07010 [Ruminococcus sp.]|nr:hypothetical protein [Ruminococcus sp.]